MYITLEEQAVSNLFLKVNTNGAMGLANVVKGNLGKCNVLY